MGIHKLLLHPADPWHEPVVTQTLLDRLGAIGLVGQAFSLEGRRHYYAGERFLELIVFLGCSPQVTLKPPDDAGEPGTGSWARGFCHVTFRESGEADFVAGSGVLVPRCPRCRRREEAWREAVDEWGCDKVSYRWRCGGCGLQARLHELDWRQSAGFGRFFVEIWGIHNAEAVPAEPLLVALHEATGGAWRYFYCHHE